MTVVILTACPPGLRGHLTRWLLEISPGVFVGHVPTRVRDLLWTRVTELAGRGRALMVHSTNGEQRLTFRVHGHTWTPEDHEGVRLIRRPHRDQPPPQQAGSSRSPSPPPENWSIAARRRRFANPKHSRKN